MEKKSIKSRLKTFVRKNRSACMAAVAVVIAVSLAATFLVADQFMNFSIGSKAAEADIQAGSVTVSDGEQDSTRTVTANFTLTGIDESDADTVKEAIKLSLYGEDDITPDSVSVTKKTSTTSSSADNTESGEDVSSVESTESGEDVSSVESTESGEDVSSVESTESGEDVSSVESTESGEDVSSVESTESGDDVSSVESTESGDDVSSVESTESGSSSNTYDYTIKVVFTVNTNVKSVTYTINYKNLTKCGTITIKDGENIEIEVAPSVTKVEGIKGNYKEIGDVTYFGSIQFKVTAQNIKADQKIHISGKSNETVIIECNTTKSTYTTSKVPFGNGKVGALTVEIRDAKGHILNTIKFDDWNGKNWVADSTAPSVNNVKFHEKDNTDNYQSIESGTTIISNSKFVVKFNITEGGSGVKANPKVYLYNGNSQIGEAKVSLTDGYYYAEFTLQDKQFFNKIKITSLSDNVKNNAEDFVKEFNTIQYLSVPDVSIAVKKGDNSATAENPIHVKNGDTIAYTISLKYSKKIESITVTINEKDSSDENKAIYVTETFDKYEKNISTFEFDYTVLSSINKTITNEDGSTVEKQYSYTDGAKIVISSIDYGGKAIEVNTQPEVVYLAPIAIDYYNVPVVTVESNNEKDENVICNNNTLTITVGKTVNAVDTSPVTHSASVEVSEISYSIDNGSSYQSIKTSMNNMTYVDMSNVKYKVSYTLTDAAGNTTTNSGEIEGTSGIVYYAPIGSDNVNISLTTNNKQNSKYSKNGDTLTVSATPDTNKKLNEKHTLSVVGNSFSLVKSNTENTETADAETITIPANYFNDNTKISYNVTFEDAAGQTYEVTEEKSGITYLAPIELINVSFKSDANDNTYAKNGSNLEFTATVNHAVSCSNPSVTTEEYSVDFEKIVSPVNSKPNNEKIEKITFNFNKVNVTKTVNVTSATLTPSFTLTDAAGNAYTSTNMPSITYDGKNPTVSISPRLDGFSKDDFGFTVTFKDENLYGEGMILNYGKDSNAATNILDASSFTNGTTEFSKSLTLSEEGTYKISASVKDKAGNAASNGGMTITIDKTKPEISTTINPDSIQVFKKGFVISDYLEWVEDYLNEVICKLSDGSGTYDWDISEPITEEGKKTVSIIITDMAGNTCNYTFEVYIDATAPAPVVKDTVSAKVLTSEKENTITKEFKLFVSLENQQIADEAPDEFTSLKLLDEDGNVVHDFIKEDGLNSTYKYDITEYGKYSLVLEAKDSAISADGGDGNTIGPVTYEINFTQGTIFDIIAENPVLYYSIISVLAIAVVAGIVFLILFLKKKNKKEA